MAKHRVIPLIDPIPFAGRIVDTLTLREPSMSELTAFGEPTVHTRSTGGTWVVVENSESVAGYMRALIVERDLDGILDHAGLADLLRLKDAVLGFFGDAREAGARTTPTSSSASSAGSAGESSSTAV
jgi:hypothetical protein